MQGGELPVSEPNQFRPLAGEAAVEGREREKNGTYPAAHDASDLDLEGVLARQALVELEVEFLADGGLLVAGADEAAGGVLDGDVGLVVVAVDNLDVHAAPAAVELALLDRGGGGAREQVLFVVLVVNLAVLVHVEVEVHGLGRDDGFVGGTKSEGSGSFTHRGGGGGEAGGGKAQESGDDGDLHLDGD
ncbi:hypothetical protein PG984_010204 [Apiospora sp. TS-2023a]